MITINPQAADVITIQLSDADQITLNTTAIVIASDGASVAWGDITGTLSDQTDLQDALDLKLDAADYNDRFLGLFSSVFDLEAAHPTASAGDYAQVDFGIGMDVIVYAWDVSDAQWSAVGSSAIASTDALPEGSSNLYLTGQRVRDTSLTGLSTATATPITSADTVLSAAGKLQAQISASGGEFLPIIGGTRWYYSDTLFFDTNYPRSGGSSTTLALNSSRIYFFPRVILEDCEITAVACQTTTGTGTIAAAIYSSDSNGNPADLLASAAGVSASSAGIKTFLISLTLARGQLVYDAILITDASVVVSSNAPARGFGRNSFATGSNFCGFLQLATAFPATAASSPASFNTMPITGIRVSA